MWMFVAAEISDDVRDFMGTVTNSFELSGSELKTVKRENLHITLKFLGEVREADVNKVCDAMRELTRLTKPFRIGISGIGYFGKKVFPTALWAGISDGAEKLDELCRNLEERLSFIRKEGRDPKPHVTFARVKSVGNPHKFVERIEGFWDVKFGEVDVNEIALKRSILRESGPLYHDYMKFKLEGDQL